MSRWWTGWRFSPTSDQWIACRSYPLGVDHVKAVAKAGFARDIKILENYDPSLPPVFANRDQLVQVFLNLIKNASEAIGDQRMARSC